MLFLLSFGLLMMSCGDDDSLPAAKNYTITYEVNATGGASVSQVQYRDKDAKWVVLENPGNSWEIRLSIPAGKALEAFAIGDIPFEGKLEIEATWSPSIDGQSAENEEINNDQAGSVIDGAKVEIEGRSLPRD